MSAINCIDCGNFMWPRGKRKRCTPCATAYTAPMPPEDPEQRGARERAERDARLAVIRAQKTARQKRARGIA